MQPHETPHAYADTYVGDADHYLSLAMKLEVEIEALDKLVADEVKRKYARGLANYPNETARTNMFLLLAAQEAEDMGVARTMASKTRRRDKYLAMATAHATLALALRRA